MTLEEICVEIERDLCRICLRNDDNLKCIYDLAVSHVDEVPLVGFLNSVTNLEFSKSDGFPETICTKCIESLTSLYALIKLCISSHEKLKNIKDRSEHAKTETTTDSISYDDNHEDTVEFFEASGNETENTIQQTEHQCSSCPKSFKSEQNLAKHLKAHVKMTTGHKCLTCGQTFGKQRQLKSHKRTHEEQKSFQCDVCGKSFGHEYLLKQHTLHHTGEKPFPCPECDKGCTTKQSLRRHMVVHDENHAKRKHKCEVCGKEFLYPSFLAEHVKNHTGEKPFLCSVCGKGFRQSGALGYHLRSHMGVKPFKCEVCDNYFMTAGILRGHMRIHTNERPYICDICGMAFRQLTDMKSHRRNHMGERRVLCFICGKRLATTGQLTVHMRSHTGEKPYKCTTCGKAFATTTALVKHDRIHTGERPYTCKVCNKSFNQSSTLKTHLNTHKSNEIGRNVHSDNIIVEEIFDSGCIIVDQDVRTQYSIGTVCTDFSGGEVNVIVVPAPAPVI